MANLINNVTDRQTSNYSNNNKYFSDLIIYNP